MNGTPGHWTPEQIRRDVQEATALFRTKRFAEPLAIWLQEVDERSAQFVRLFDEHDVARPHDLSADDVANIIEAGLLDALRYLPGPPISADDLRKLADVDSLVPAKLRADREGSQRVLDTIRATVDPRRFPWLAENRNPTGAEKSAAIFASALMLANSRVLMLRRTTAKTEQEHEAREQLKAHGLRGERLRTIRTHAQFPAAGIVSENEVRFGRKKADLLARLWDDRLMPIECKVSNSAVNSYKRLNHETLEKLQAWIEDFGRANVVPSAVLAGVYSPQNILDAQATGLTIFWSHRISDLGAFVEGSRR